MDRRAFVQWLGLGWLASTLPGCGSKLTAWSRATPTAGSAVAQTPNSVAVAQAQTAAYVPVGTVSELDRAGFLLNRRTPFGPVMVVRDPAANNTLQAVNPACPHQGCIVDWRDRQEDFHCACHGARFAADGALLQGPARTALENYSVRLENGNIMVARVTESAAGQPPESTASDRSTPYSDDEGYEHDDDGYEHDDDHDDDHDREDDDHDARLRPAARFPLA